MTHELKEHLDKEGINELHQLIESLGICKIQINEEGIKSYSQDDINKWLLEQIKQYSGVKK